MSALRLLLCTDMDRTVIPNGTQSETPGAREWFRRLCGDERICLVYATGRDEHLARQAITEYQLPVPDFAITDVGSMLYRITGDNWDSVDLWQQTIAPDWHGRLHADLKRALAPIDQLELQEQSKQNHFKLSYYLNLNAQSHAIMARMEAVLENLGVAATLIWSVDEAAHVGLIDVLPKSADKLNALSFIARYLGYDETELLFAGDSGNDLAVLESRIPAVLVANGQSEVRETALQRAASKGFAQRLYLAGPDGWPGNGNYCSGVIQGILHFYPELRDTVQRIVA